MSNKTEAQLKAEQETKEAKEAQLKAEQETKEAKEAQLKAEQETKETQEKVDQEEVVEAIDPKILIKMVKTFGDGGNELDEPFECDVHPNEVQNYARGGFVKK
jgi:hypothetical protein